MKHFFRKIRSLGRVDNFTRQTQRVAEGWGHDSDQPADQTALTEKDKVIRVQIMSQSALMTKSRKQVSLTVVTTAVDEALEKAKAAALGWHWRRNILGSSLNKTCGRPINRADACACPGQKLSGIARITSRALGRTASFNLERNDNSGPGASGDDAPVIVSLSLTDDERTACRHTNMSVLDDSGRGRDVCSKSKRTRWRQGVEVKASGFQRQPTRLGDGADDIPFTDVQHAWVFVESLQKLGKVESMTVQRIDRPDQTRTDDSAPAEISLRMHNQGNIVADKNGLWETLRQTFGQGTGALFGSVRTIGVLVAFIAPWVVALIFVAWIGRRLYIRGRK